MQCGRRRPCEIDIATDVVVDSALITMFGDLFAIEVTIVTDVFAFAGFEIEVLSDFFNTGSIDVATAVDGVVVEQLRSAPVPEPSSFLLLVIGLAIIGSVGARRRLLPLRPPPGGARWRS